MVTTINWKDPKSKVSKYFTVGEVTNFDVARIPSDPFIINNILTLAKKLDQVREAWGSGIIVNSWYRPPLVNKRIGGATRSQHLTGGAADIRPANGQGLKFENWLDTVAWKSSALGYGQLSGKGFTHIDLRPQPIRWNY